MGVCVCVCVFDHDDFLHAFFELRSISRHFGPFRALLKVLPVSELYFRATGLDLVHPVFLLKAVLAVHVRYGDNASQNKAKKSVQGALVAKPEVEIWRRSVFLTLRHRLSICPKVGQSTQSLPVCKYTSGLTTTICLQCFDAVGWAAGRASGL